MSRIKESITNIRLQYARADKKTRQKIGEYMLFGYKGRKIHK
ncbi:MAG: hypothetical protein Q4B63_10700 [Clostridium perfringens]|nr:hypothetical protein [Clostridium perfringens]